jgi:opacity protein-like surface antigen
MRSALLAALLCAASSASSQTCLVCGEVRAIRELNAPNRAPPAPGATASGTQSDLYAGPVVGTVAQFQFGGARTTNRASRGEGWSFGAAGTPEMRTRLGEIAYEITVKMDSGERHTLRRRDGHRFHVGQRVAVRQGELEPM